MRENDVLSIWGGRRLTEEEIEPFLREARIARLCSLNDDGTIHAAPVWFKYENGKIVIVTPSRSCKARNVKRNRNVTILIDVEGPPTRGVLIYGEARLDKSDLVPTVVSIAEKYVPREEAEGFAEFVGKGMNLKITVKPERIASFNF